MTLIYASSYFDRCPAGNTGVLFTYRRYFWLSLSLSPPPSSSVNSNIIIFYIDGLGSTMLSWENMLETRHARSQMIYWNCWRYFLDKVQAASARDKLQYHTSVHFLTNRSHRGTKKDQLSCRCSSGAERRALWEARATFLSLQGKSLPLSCMDILRVAKKFLLSETCANATSFRHVDSIPWSSTQRSRNFGVKFLFAASDENLFFFVIVAANVTLNRSTDLIELWVMIADASEWRLISPFWRYLHDEVSTLPFFESVNENKHLNQWSLIKIILLLHFHSEMSIHFI